jgi:hypothetical protein
MIVRIVNVQDVDALNVEALEALFERPHYGVVTEVESWSHRRRVGPLSVLARVTFLDGHEESPDFGSQYHSVTTNTLQGFADSDFTFAVAIEGRRVNQVHSEREGAAHYFQSL